MKLQLTIASFTICLLFSPMLRAQESPRIVSYDLTVQIDVPNRQVEVGGSFEVDFHDSVLNLVGTMAPCPYRHTTPQQPGDNLPFDTLAPAPRPIHFPTDGP